MMLRLGGEHDRVLGHGQGKKRVRAFGGGGVDGGGVGRTGLARGRVNREPGVGIELGGGGDVLRVEMIGRDAVERSQ